ncbi:glycosyltransferase family 4 protein [Candidatus Pacearchaeota archaeon]|nr:glycosyltransferase family 4 protein [Candidatus Pacearchaeota archaeon]
MSLKNLKIIMLAHASHSYFLGDGKGDPKEIIKGGWFSQVARQLRKFNPEINVECWCPEKHYKKEEDFLFEKIKFRVFPTSFSPVYALDFSIPMMRALKKEIKENKQNGIKTIIHMHEYHNFHGLMIATLFKNEKIIGQHHGGSWPLKHIMQTKKYKLVFPLFMIGQIWENLVLKNISCFFALSEDEMDYLKERAVKSRIKFQTMGIEDEYFKREEKKTARKKLKLKEKDKIIIYIGRLTEIKGIKYLIDAMESLKEVKLKIIGFSQELQRFKDYAKEKNLENVEFLGGKFGEEKMLYLSAADALVLPSAKEGAPVTIMEALARNTPVVVTDVGGIPLMVKNGREGVVIKPKSSEEIVRGVKEILSWKSKNVQQYAERYRWRDIVKETIKEYNF